MAYFANPITFLTDLAPGADVILQTESCEFKCILFHILRWIASTIFLTYFFAGDGGNVFRGPVCRWLGEEAGELGEVNNNPGQAAVSLSPGLGGEAGEVKCTTSPASQLC